MGSRLDKYIGKRVKVAKNLHENQWSIRYKGRVVGYSTSIVLEDCSFIVQEAGREKVRQTGHKNLHAFIEGTLTRTGAAAHRSFLYQESIACKDRKRGYKKATYNPYRDDEFVVLHPVYKSNSKSPTNYTSTPIYSAKRAILDIRHPYKIPGERYYRNQSPEVIVKK